MECYDVIIMGAGPAGGMAANQLGAAGARTLVIDKARLPRHKPCGGALSPVVKKIIPWNFSDYVEVEITRFRNLHNFEKPVDTPGVAAMFVDRQRFDMHFIERALRLYPQVELRDGCAVTSVEEDDDGVRVVTEKGDTLRAAFLVAADGAFSKTARCLGLNHGRLLGGAVDAEVTVTDAAFVRERERATFNYFCLPDGYGWIFPKRDNVLTCGVGSWRQRRGVARAMDEFLARSFASGEIREVRSFGHPIPLYIKHAQIATKRVCLVGDAANLVDPIMGEGIRFALQSGALAGDVITANLRAADGGDCRTYQTAIHEGIGAEFAALARFIMPMFLDAPQHFYDRFIEKKQNYAALANSLAQKFTFATRAAPTSAAPNPA